MKKYLLVVLMLAVVSVGLAFRAPGGLVGDGKTDNTQAIRALFKELGTLRLPRGVFRITETIVIDLDKVGPACVVGDGDSTLKMDGPGPALKFVGTHIGSAAPSTFKPGVLDKERTPTVAGIEILGGHPEADAIEAEGTMQLTVDRVTIRDCRHGIHLVKRNRNVLVANCHIYNNRGVGVFLDSVNLHQTNIVGSHISYCKQGGVVTKGGEVRNLHIGTCDIEGCMDRDGPPSANVHLDSTGGSIAEAAITGCTIQHSNVPGSANIRITGKGVGGLKNVQGATREGHVTITGNVLSDVKVNVDIADARGVTITGNTFWMGYEHNLRIVDSEQIVLGDNVFERNPRYDYGDATTTRNGILFRNVTDSTITGLHLHQIRQPGGAFIIEEGRRLNIAHLTILDCAEAGLVLRNVSDSRVQGCLIRNDLKDVGTFKAMVVAGGSGNRIGE